MSTLPKTAFADFKLGKLQPKKDLRTLQLANYIESAVIKPAPPKFNWSTGITKWGMMKNNTVGDCTCAAAGHLIMEWTADNGKPFVPKDSDILKAYAAITGYDPRTGENDNGAVAVDVLNFWRKSGIAGHAISAYAGLEPKNHEHVRLAVYLFGGCYIGLAMPVSAQTQRVWSVPPGGASGTGAPGSWGGHAVPILAYDSQTVTVITWGKTVQVTWSFLDTYCDESYAILSPDFLVKDKAPNGFAAAELQKDLKTITR